MAMWGWRGERNGLDIWMVWKRAHGWAGDVSVMRLAEMGEPVRYG